MKIIITRQSILLGSILGFSLILFFAWLIGTPIETLRSLGTYLFATTLFIAFTLLIDKKGHEQEENES